MIQGTKPSFLEAKKTLLPKYYNEIIAPIMIAEGCRFSCTYCITHFARGALRSFPIQEIAADVYSAIKQGCKEIQLTAQDTASYGLDIDTNLGTLLAHLCKLDGDFRIRVGMMNPRTVQQNIDSILVAYQHYKIYKFLHLPVQSGDDELLKKMKAKPVSPVESFLRHKKEGLLSGGKIKPHFLHRTTSWGLKRLFTSTNGKKWLAYLTQLRVLSS